MLVFETLHNMNKRSAFFLVFVFLLGLSSLNAQIKSKPIEYHVAIDGNDAQPGTPSKPLRTIMAAAKRAMPGDIIDECARGSI